VDHRGVGVFEGLPQKLKVGRYHSLYARRAALPECLEITAESDDGIIMGVRHRTLPVEAVQFHPESLLSQHNEYGLTLIRNLIRQYGRVRRG
jgi:anthranilate/para-aminobenzoate synthase component II